MNDQPAHVVQSTLDNVQPPAPATPDDAPPPIAFDLRTLDAHAPRGHSLASNDGAQSTLSTPSAPQNILANRVVLAEDAELDSAGAEPDVLAQETAEVRAKVAQNGSDAASTAPSHS